jgi:hypothetical protein
MDDGLPVVTTGDPCSMVQDCKSPYIAGEWAKEEDEGASDRGTDNYKVIVCKCTVRG